MKKDNGINKKLSGKNSPTKGAKKKLEFKQKLPLAGKTIYLDVKDARYRKKLDDSLRSLGAEVEKFLSKEINYVISSNTTTTLPNKTNDGDRPDSPSFVSTPSPFNCGQGGSPTENNKQKTQTRAQAMVKLAQSQAQITPVLQNAEKFGIKVIPLDAALKWVEKESSKLQTTSTAPKPQVIKKKTQFKIKKLRAPLIKFEAINLHYRPIQLELDSWPHCNVDTPAGSCPFDGSTVGRLQKTEPEYRDKVVASIPDHNDKDSIDTLKDKNLSKGNQNEGTSTSKLIGMPILTAGDLKRRQKMKRAVEKKRGYCECCQIKFDNLDKHLREEDHRQFARDKNNFTHLDLIIRTVNSPAKFLQKILQQHCIRNKEKKDENRLSAERINKKMKSPQKLTPRSSTPRKSKHVEQDVKENDICRRLISSRRSGGSSGLKVHPNQQQTKSVMEVSPTPNLLEKQALVSPCSVVMNTINLEAIGTKSTKTETPTPSVIKQKKLIIRNMAIGSLQIASTSPDKILRDKEGETIKKQNPEDSESGISKSVYFSSDYSGSESNASSEEVTFKMKTEKVVETKSNLPKKRAHSKSRNIRRLRSRTKEIPSNYYKSKVRSAKKQLAKKVSPKNKQARLNKLCKMKTKLSINNLKKMDNMTSEAGQSSSQPLKQNKTVVQLLDKLSVSSPISKPSNTPISIPINMNEKCLKFSEKGGRKSRNSMEVQFHDYMIFDSLADVDKKKKSKISKTKCAPEFDVIEEETCEQSIPNITSDKNNIESTSSQSNVSKHVADRNVKNRKLTSVISVSSDHKETVKYSTSYSSQTIISISSKDRAKRKPCKHHKSETSMADNSDTSHMGKFLKPSKHLSSQTEISASSGDVKKVVNSNSDCTELVRKIRRNSKPISSQTIVSISSENAEKSSAVVRDSSQVVRKIKRHPKSSSSYTSKIMSSDSRRRETSDSDRSQYVRRVRRQGHQDMDTESDKKDSSISQMSGITRLPDSQKTKSHATSETTGSQDSKLFQNVIVEIEPLQNVSRLSKTAKDLPDRNKSQTREIVSQGNVSPCHEIPLNFLPSPVFKKSPAFRNQYNTSVTSGRPSLDKTIIPEETCVEDVVSPRSGVSSTPRRRVKKQKRSYHTLSASKSRENVSHDPLSTNDVRATRRSLHNELYKASLTPKSDSNLRCVDKPNIDSNIFNTPNNIDSRLKIRHSSESTSVTGGSKKYKLNQSWRVLSDRSVSKLLESDQDTAPFLGFEEKDTTEAVPLSDLSFEDQSEIDLDDSYDWVIHNTASDENDFEDLVPHCAYSSPSKASNSSWLDACEDYVLNSVSKSLTSSCSTPTNVSQKSKLSLRRSRSKSKMDVKHKMELTPRKLRKRKRHHSGDALFTIKENDGQENVELKAEEKSVDEDIVFNFNSPQKMKHELGVLCDIKYEVCQGNSQDKKKIFKARSPKKHKFQMKYFKNDSRASPKNSSKDQLRLHSLHNPQAHLIIVTPPKNAVKI